MRLPATAHTQRPWLIHEIAPDFELEDVWLLRTPGGPDDLAELVAQLASDDFPAGAPLPVRIVWEARWKLGALLGWDGEDSRVGSRVASLRERLPEALRSAPAGTEMPPFSSIFQLEDEWAAELANRTVHAVMHVGWVPHGSGRGYQAQMGVLVKPHGALGRAYLAAIRPFRHLLVYPVFMRRIERQWRERATDACAASHCRDAAASG